MRLFYEPNNRAKTPLTDPLGVQRQVGVTAFGIGCGRPTYPGVYTQVDFYYDWIMETIANNS